MDAEVNSPLETRPARSVRRFRRLALASIVLAILASGSYYAWQAWGASNNARGEYITAAVQRGDLEDAVTATGTLQPQDFVDVGTQVSGQLKKLHRGDRRRR